MAEPTKATSAPTKKHSKRRASGDITTNIPSRRDFHVELGEADRQPKSMEVPTCMKRSSPVGGSNEVPSGSPQATASSREVSTKVVVVHR